MKIMYAFFLMHAACFSHLTHVDLQEYEAIFSGLLTVDAVTSIDRQVTGYV